MPEHPSPQPPEPARTAGGPPPEAPALADHERTVVSADDVDRVVQRIAHELLERNRRAEDLVLLGVPTRGVPLAERLAAAVERVEGVRPASGSLDVTMYRDDLRRNPTRGLAATDVPVDVTDRVVVLVDDVLFSGRTIRAALDAVADLGRPRAVRLVVLVDRGHRELPIRADHVGRNLPTAADERVSVRLVETDGSDGVDILRPLHPGAGGGA
ncbi:bifunctional pyr operon transcriptional regulator/uracil phosphoribosyltransferase PyrR [Aquipuribacter sp. SD81]|uniref:bifunctional pyr operon transcriptional regulator/uracil phosphoribosyltransferase PyrR n=1 Tax=Aquipuribacter sp. SD81 TaxID=3127703 RepID=UPI00301A033E